MVTELVTDSNSLSLGSMEYADQRALLLSLVKDHTSPSSSFMEHVDHRFFPTCSNTVERESSGFVTIASNRSYVEISVAGAKG